MADQPSIPAPGTATHYVSVGWEVNSKGVRVEAKGSAWYTSDGQTHNDLANLTKAHARSMTVASLAAAAVYGMVEQGVNQEQVNQFIALVEANTTALCEQIGTDADE